MGKKLTSIIFISFLALSNNALAKKVVYTNLTNQQTTGNYQLKYNLEMSKISIVSGDKYDLNKETIDKIQSYKPILEFEVKPDHDLTLGLNPSPSFYYDRKLIPSEEKDLLNSLEIKTVTLGQKTWTGIKETIPYIVEGLLRAIKPRSPLPLEFPMVEPTVPIGMHGENGRYYVFSPEAVNQNKVKCIRLGGRPVEIELKFRATQDSYVEEFEGNNGEKCIKVEFDKINVDKVLPVEKIPYGLETDNFYVSSCRSAKVYIKQFPNSEPIVIPITVADSNYVQSLFIPENGKIIKKSGCGYYVQSQNVH